MTIKETVRSMTLEEKAKILTVVVSMDTYENESLGIKRKTFADASHGVRASLDDNCTHFPNLCCLAASWDKDISKKMGEALADDCIEHGISMILGPGINIKKNILCGRNFEYLSEDPVLAGELAASYINGVEGRGVGTSLKHFAVNNQEKYRDCVSVEVDERTLREIYLKAFEIAVKKSNPTSIMCAYNKLNAIWCSENRFLLTEILRDEWGYDGFVVSDWGAVQDTCRALMAGIDLYAPQNFNMLSHLEKGLEEGRVTMEAIDTAVERMLKFCLREPAEEIKPYNRDEQHKIAREIAAAGVTLLKNEDDALPITAEKYKKIGVIGGYAESPLIGGQGAAEVYPDPKYIDSPLEELKKRFPDIEFKYNKLFDKSVLLESMIWSKSEEIGAFMRDCDAIIFFIGSLVGEDTENFDRNSAALTGNFLNYAKKARAMGKKVIVVLQSGGALVLEDYWLQSVHSLIHMWLGGEAAGGGIADVLSGDVNPSAKLPETFPTKLRTDFEYPGTPLRVEYNEKLDVGYRYYDKHPDEIVFPFGHGLSYTTFEYSNPSVELKGKDINISFDLENIGDFDGNEVAQIYVSDPVSIISKPIKELKAFEKVFLKKGEKKTVNIVLPVNDIAYYNTSLHDWVVENGVYDILIAASSRDIRLKASFNYKGDMPYSVQKLNEAMVG